MSVASPFPLSGKRIVVTRARSQASSLVSALTELGAEVIELPTVEIEPIESYEVLDEALRNLARYQWLIVTSANTARILGERIAALRLDPAECCGVRRVAIGSATARAMMEEGMTADIVPKQYVAESLVAELGYQVNGSRILLARATVARDVIPDELSRHGAQVDVVDAYRTVTPDGAVQRVRKVFSGISRLPDAITFTSSSTVKNFFALLRDAGLPGVFDGVAMFSIGPVTSETLREYGWKATAEASTHDVAGVVAAIVNFKP